ncbi:hypothetical protein EDC04DRAFT_2611329 [Pisolithus marmoratus]|nr:hypothetical protein EDC04DRAFT_2611329 [Pisolithus marmoratus]
MKPTHPSPVLKHQQRSPMVDEMGRRSQSKWRQLNRILGSTQHQHCDDVSKQSHMDWCPDWCMASRLHLMTESVKSSSSETKSKMLIEIILCGLGSGLHLMLVNALGPQASDLVQLVDFQLNGILEFLQCDPWPIVNDEHPLQCTKMGLQQQTSGLLELELLPDSANGDIVLSDLFATSIFWQNFLHIFNKDDEDFVDMVFNTTFDIQNEHQWLCTLKWLLQLGKLFSWAPGVLIQITMHYQYSSGQQCLCVMTIACNCAEAGSSSIAASSDQGATIALMARIAVSKEVCCYWKEDPATFRLSDNFHIYPQFMFHTQRSQFLQVFNNSPDGIDFYRKAEHQDQEGYENFKELLEAPVTNAWDVITSHFLAKLSIPLSQQDVHSTSSCFIQSLCSSLNHHKGGARIGRHLQSQSPASQFAQALPCHTGQQCLLIFPTFLAPWYDSNTMQTNTGSFSGTLGSPPPAATPPSTLNYLQHAGWQGHPRLTHCHWRLRTVVNPNGLGWQIMGIMTIAIWKHVRFYLETTFQ